MDIVKTKLGQAVHMGKWEAAAAMVRLVADLRAELEERGILTGGDLIAIDNVTCSFLTTVPAKVAEEVRHG